MKFIRDPVHDIIRVEQDFILELLNTAAVQRLRRIRQLGLAWLIYPGAEHSRFTHSLGVYHLAARLIRQLEGVDANGQPTSPLFDTTSRNTLLAAAILHDVGHGPFSHVFERVSATLQTGAAIGHESWSRRVLYEDPEVNQILTAVDRELPARVDAVVAGTFEPHYVTAALTSQLDVDRFDYLLRDSLMTGSRYGVFDLEWMLRTLTVREVTTGAPGSGGAKPLQTIVVDGRRGISGLELYALGRHYMYQHVYYHKTIRSAEMLLGAILRRAAQLVRQGDSSLGSGPFRKLTRSEGITVPEYCSLNDFVVLSWIEDWAAAHTDPILKDLAARLTHRKLFKAIPAPSGKEAYADARQEIVDLLERRRFTADYYFLRDDGAKDVAYKGYLYNLERGKDADEAEIWYIDDHDAPHRLSAGSGLLARSAEALDFQEERWFLPEEVRREASGIVSRISGRGRREHG